MKNTKGITLIALIVTIIVLIILAGISVNLLFGDNGILNKAKDASEAQSIAEIKEKIGLDITAKQIETKGIVTKADLETILGAYGTVNYNQDETIKSITTTEKGYEIALSDIYSGRIEEPVIFTQGQKVKIGNEKFYVLTENDSASATTIELFAMYNLNKNPETEGKFAGHYMQLPNAAKDDTKCRFSNTNYWSSETKYPFDLNIYPIPTTGENAETIATNVILKADDYAKALGGQTATGKLLNNERANELSRQIGADWGNIKWGKENKQGTSNDYYLMYWLATANSNRTAYFVYGSDKRFSVDDYWVNYGCRPIITVPKDIVEAINE